MYVKTDAMEKLIAEVLFRGRPAPAGYYLGLGYGPLPSETATLANVTEVQGPGYARAHLTNGEVDFPDLILQDGDWKVSSLAQTFAAVGGDWTQAEYGFLIDDATEELYVAVGLEPFRNLDGDSFDATFEYQDS